MYFPLFFPLRAETRESFLLPVDHLIQQLSGVAFRFPRRVGVDVYCGTDVRVPQQFLHVLGSGPIGQEVACESVPLLKCTPNQGQGEFFVFDKRGVKKLSVGFRLRDAERIFAGHEILIIFGRSQAGEIPLIALVIVIVGPGADCLVDLLKAGTAGQADLILTYGRRSFPEARCPSSWPGETWTGGAGCPSPSGQTSRWCNGRPGRCGSGLGLVGMGHGAPSTGSQFPKRNPPPGIRPVLRPEALLCRRQ